MAQVFRDETRYTLQESGMVGLTGLWFFTLYDLLKTAIAEHLWDVFHMSMEKLLRWSGPAAAILPILVQLEEIGQIANLPVLRRELSMALVTTRCALFRKHPSPDLRAAIERSLSPLVAAAADPLTQARALVTLDRPQEAVPLLEKPTAQTEADERHGLWLSAAVLLCLAYQDIGETTAALACLHRAVSLAATPGYIRLFLDEGEPLRRLLERTAQQKTAPNYAATLLTHFPAAAPLITPPPASDPLSPREREVLQLIAGGLTNQEIAAKLVIAPSTAKRHTSNIYNKLGVNNRAEATARAYELGIVNLE